MTDKKPTDSEIVKALEEHIDFSEKMGICYSPIIYIPTLKNVLDLINRLQAENKRLSTLAELGNTRANDYRVMRDRALKAEAENERLYGDNMTYKLRRARATARLDKAKAEAYKEFAERLKMRAINRYNEFEDYQEYPYATITHIDELLKELVGDNETVL